MYFGILQNNFSCFQVCLKSDKNIDIDNLIFRHKQADVLLSASLEFRKVTQLPHVYVSVCVSLHLRAATCSPLKGFS
jgi:hypothetical protein